MRIGFSTGYREGYWGYWPWVPMMGGSEHMVVQLAREMARVGHLVTVRLPHEVLVPRLPEPGLVWIPESAAPQSYDRLFCFDDFARRDSGPAVLVACRSDPPPQVNFEEMVFLSKTHARLMGHPDRPVIGGGVRLGDYRGPRSSEGQRVIYCSSPDRGGEHAAALGRGRDFVATYARSISRDELVSIQRSARVLIHPCDPPRPSEFFGMAVLEALAAGTPCIVSDADALPELWGAVATVLPRPIDYAQWDQEIEDLLADRVRWERESATASRFAEQYDWPRVAQRYLELA